MPKQCSRKQRALPRQEIRSTKTPKPRPATFGGVDFDRVVAAWIRTGRLTQEPHGSGPPEGWPPPEALAYVRELMTRGVDGNRLLGMLTGSHPSQPQNLLMIVNAVKRRAAWHPRTTRRNQELLSLWRHYLTYQRILTDEAIRKETRDALREDLQLVAWCLSGMRAPHSRRSPKMGITVTPTTALSRQGFWSAPIVAIVNYLTPIFGSRAETYRATAKLLHLAFGYPDRPALVERRYLHTVRNQTARSRG